MTDRQTFSPCLYNVLLWHLTIHWSIQPIIVVNAKWINVERNMVHGTQCVMPILFRDILCDTLRFIRIQTYFSENHTRGQYFLLVKMLRHVFSELQNNPKTHRFELIFLPWSTIICHNNQQTQCPTVLTCIKYYKILWHLPHL